MKHYLSILFLIFTIHSYGQEERFSSKTSCFVRINNVIRVYADSLNFLEPDQDLPRFLFSPLFDVGSQVLIESCTKEDFQIKPSFRLEIINRVYNLASLEKLVKKNDPRLDKLYDRDELAKGHYNPDMLPRNIDMMDKSWRDLGIMRIEDLYYRD